MRYDPNSVIGEYNVVFIKILGFSEAKEFLKGVFVESLEEGLITQDIMNDCAILCHIQLPRTFINVIQKHIIFILDLHALEVHDEAQQVFYVIKLIPATLP